MCFVSDINQAAFGIKVRILIENLKQNALFQRVSTCSTHMIDATYRILINVTESKSDNFQYLKEYRKTLHPLIHSLITRLVIDSDPCSSLEIISYIQISYL